MIARFHVDYGVADAWSAIRGASRPQTAEYSMPGFGPDWAVLPVFRGREALYLILKCLGLPDGARVGIPLFACSVVAKTVVEAGMTPVFLDSNPRTYTLDPAASSAARKHLDCIVAVHALGYPCDYDALLQAAVGVPIIEDCAHGLGSSYHGQPLGSLGETSFFSFGFFKPAGFGGGGCVVTRSKEVAQRIRAMLGTTATPESFSGTVKQAMVCLLRGLAYTKPVYTAASIVISTRTQNDDRDAACEGPVISGQWNIRRADAALLRERITINRPVREQNQPFWSAARAAIGNGWWILPEPSEGVWNHFLLPVQAPSTQDRDAAVAALKKLGVGAANLYPDRAAALRSAGYKGGCPTAEFISETILQIPAHPCLSLNDQKRVLSGLRQVTGGKLC